MNRLSSPTAVFGDKLGEVNTVNHYTSRPLTRRAHRRARSRRDGRVLQGALRQRRRLHVLHGRRVQGRRGAAARRALCRLAAVDRQAGQPVQGRRHQFPTDSREGARRERQGAEGRDASSSFFADPPIEENEQTRVEAATDVLEIALRDILREELGETYGVSVGLSQARRSAAAATSRSASAARPERRQDDRARAAGGRAAQKEGPSADLTNRAKESARRDLRDRA